MRWILRGTMFLVAVVALEWSQDKEFGTWSAGFLMAAWLMLEPGLWPALILLPVAGLTGIVTLLWQQPWL